MKTILMGLILSTSLFAQATSVDLTKVLATVTGYEEGISQITLIEDGRLQVVNNKGIVKTVQISKVALDRLSGQIIQLSNIELVENVKTKTCKMIIMPTLSNLSVANYDYETLEYGRTLTLVLTRQSCALSHEIYPKEQYAMYIARELRAQLMILALNTLEK